MSALAAVAVLTTGWVLTHPVYPAVFAGCAAAVAAWAWLLLRFTRTPPEPLERELSVRMVPGLPLEDTVTLPYTQHTEPYDPDYFTWVSRWAEHQERIGRPVTLHYQTSPAAQSSAPRHPGAAIKGTAAAAGACPPAPPPLPNWGAR